jgi:hypothetical protein
MAIPNKRNVFATNDSHALDAMKKREERCTMALPYDQIEALAHKLAVADIGADEDEQLTPNAKAVVGELDLKDLVTVVEIAVEIAEYRQEKLEQVLGEIRSSRTRDR